MLVLHHREAAKPSNTGRLALLRLANAARYVRGRQGAPVDLGELADPDRRPLLLFPDDDAPVLDLELVAADDRPVTLVVPDGTWPQARRTAKREPLIAPLPRVRPPPGPATRYRIRREHVPGGLATAEAIARAFGVLEGPDVRREIERVFDLMVARTLVTRGGPWGEVAFD